MIEKKTEKQIIDKEIGKFNVEVHSPVPKIKWNIRINQRAIIENDIKINMKEAVIFDFIFDFIGSDNAEKLFIGGEVYHWIAYQHIIDSLPLLDISNKNIIARHMKILVEQQMLDKIICKEKGNKTYFKIGTMAKQVFFGDLSTQKSLPIYSKVETSLPESRKLSTEKSNNSYINTIINSNINKEERIKEKPIDKKEHLDIYIENEQKAINNITLSKPPLNNDNKTDQEEKRKKEKTSAQKEKKKKDVKEVIDYLNEKCGKKFTCKNKANLEARLNDGYSVDDCKQVIDNKSKDEFFKQFPKLLNPTTLFRPTHFENYLNEYTYKPQKQQYNYDTNIVYDSIDL
jgi:uncharacterized phage protein (TIGR02220 family)